VPGKQYENTGNQELKVLFVQGEIYEDKIFKMDRKRVREKRETKGRRGNQGNQKKIIRNSNLIIKRNHAPLFYPLDLQITHCCIIVTRAREHHVFCCQTIIISGKWKGTFFF